MLDDQPIEWDGTSHPPVLCGGPGQRDVLDRRTRSILWSSVTQDPIPPHVPDAVHGQHTAPILVASYAMHGECSGSILDGIPAPHGDQHQGATADVLYPIQRKTISYLEMPGLKPIT